MSEVAVSVFEPDERLVGKVWRRTERGTLRKYGVETAGLLCGRSGLRGGVHVFEVRVVAVDGEDAGGGAGGAVKGELEVGAVEGRKMVEMWRRVRDHPHSRRAVRVGGLVRGDTVTLILDLMEGVVAVMCNRKFVSSRRGSTDFVRIDSRVLDHGYVAPTIVAGVGQELELDIVRSGSLVYSFRDVEDFSASRAPRREALLLEAKSAVQSGHTIVPIGEDIIQGERKRELHVKVGDLVLFDAYENQGSTSWEFETAEPPNDDMLVFVGDYELDEPFVSDMIRQWVLQGSDVSYYFHCRTPGLVRLYFGFVHPHSLDRELDNSLLIHIGDATEEQGP